MNLSLKTREILWFLTIALVSYAVIILVFAWLYYSTYSIGFYNRPANTMEIITFEKAIYFSVVSFHTIGFGDIYPVTPQGRFIMICQSFLSLFFTAIFSGFLVYFVIHRPNDMFSTKKVYIRYRKDQWSLSIRLGNKGRTIIDLKGKFEAWIVKHNTRVRMFQYEEEMADLERILYFDINLDDPANLKLKESLQRALSKDINLHMKFAFIGNDIRTGDQVAHAAFYSSDDLRFGTMFLNVYSWDSGGQRSNFQWRNFEKIALLDEEMTESFKLKIPA